MKPDPSSSLFRHFTSEATKNPNRLAFTFIQGEREVRHYTFHDLFMSASTIARALAGHELQAHSLIGILVDSQETQVLHYLAALSLGLTPAILTPPNQKMNLDYYRQTIRGVLEYCDFTALITSMNELAPTVPVLEPYTLRSIGTIPGGGTVTDPEAAFLQYSSGTTGIKRGVVVTNDAVLSQLNAYGEAIGLTPHDTIVSWLPLYHDMGFIACLNLPLAFGAHVVMMHPINWVANPVIYLRAVDRYGATLGWNPNFAYAFMADRIRDSDLKELHLTSLRGLVNCSEPVTELSQKVFLDRFRSYGLRPDVFWGCYAMAETTFAITHGTSSDPGYLDLQGPANVVRSNSRPFVSVGKPLRGVELKIVSDVGQTCSDREVGELWVKSPFNLTGYHNNPEASALVLSNGWYKTGDLGYQIGDQFFVSGRKKDIVIVAGANLYPQDIEDEVARVRGTKAGRVVAFAEFDARLQTERVVVLAETDVTDRQENLKLLTEIRQRLQAAFNVSDFTVNLVAPGWLIKSSAGKMARRANQAKWLTQSEGLNLSRTVDTGR